MIFIADVHGASRLLRRLDRDGEQLVILGDLINFVDYRSLEGIISEVCGVEFVARWIEARTAGRTEAAKALWRDRWAGREKEFRSSYMERVVAAYVDITAALEGSGAIVTHGNVDHPDILREYLPDDCTFIEWGVVDVEGQTVGIVGGGAPTPLGVPGEVPEDVMADRLGRLGPVDLLATHVAPAVGPLQTDVISGGAKGSPAVLDYLVRHQPRDHYFGDIHQPQAARWQVGGTECRNVGYFRATGRGLRHP